MFCVRRRSQCFLSNLFILLTKPNIEQKINEVSGIKSVLTGRGHYIKKRPNSHLWVRFIGRGHYKGLISPVSKCIKYLGKRLQQQ